MNEQNSNYLKTTYPKIFSGKYGGFACGDGWFNIINMMCQLIQSHVDWRQDTCPQVVAVQVKEKFGTLRFYYEGGDEYIQGITSMAEAMSGVTCEACGVPGTARHGGWIHVYCDPCEEKRIAQRKADGYEV